ncbi:MAG TPA: glycosyltransferase family 9 protein [Nocardioidaceae bacterium]|nr:glycosyltransferase family 9 protein [Nocardioidaceae bacterium]
MRGARAGRHAVGGRVLALSRPVALVLRALGLGDFLTGVPALRGVRRALPDHELVLAAPTVLAPLVDRANTADRVHQASGLDPLHWTGPAPDIAVNLHGRGPQSHRLLLDTAPGRLAAFSCPDAGVDGPEWTAEEHEVDRWCRLVSRTLDTAVDPHDIELAASSDPPLVSEAVVVHPGAAFPARRWPAGRFAAVARWARDQGWPVVVTGSAAEGELAEEVRRLAGLPGDSVLAGHTDLAQLGDVVACARLVVCGDTGLGHLASAFRTPSVVLFGPTPPRLWGPPADGPHAVIWHGGSSGDPWADTVDPGLLAISVAEVLERAGAMTRRTPAPAHGTS